MNQKELKNLSIALKTWCKDQGITAPKLGRKMNYTEQHAYRLLNGASPITVETIGRFVLSFGPDATQVWLKLAGFHIQSSETEPPADDKAKLFSIIEQLQKGE